MWKMRVGKQNRLILARIVAYASTQDFAAKRKRHTTKVADPPPGKTQAPKFFWWAGKIIRDLIKNPSGVQGLDLQLQHDTPTTDTQ